MDTQKKFYILWSIDNNVLKFKLIESHDFEHYEIDMHNNNFLTEDGVRNIYGSFTWTHIKTLIHFCVQKSIVWSTLYENDIHFGGVR